MANPLSKDLREKIVKHKQNGENNINISKWLLVSLNSVRRIWANFCEFGNIEHRPLNRGRKPMVTEDEMKKIEQEIKINPDITLEEIKEKFELKISISAISRRISKLGYTFKKRLYIRRLKNEKML
jgi:transposase